VDDREGELAEFAGSESRALLLCGSGLDHGRFADERTDHERLLARSELLPDELVGIGSGAVFDHPRLDGLPTRRKLAQRGRVEVAVGRQREGSRDGGRGHVQRMGRRAVLTLAIELGALSHPEAMLLVHHCNSQRRELDRRLDQSMGTHRDHRLAVCQTAQWALSFGFGNRARQQHDRGAIGSHHP